MMERPNNESDTGEGLHPLIEMNRRWPEEKVETYPSAGPSLHGDQ